jgi:hypothetical protein
MQDEPMPFEQNDKTKLFIDAVKKLIDSGEVKNQAAIVDALEWDKTLMSNVMNGRKNVPNEVYRKFTEVFQVAAPPTDADYRDKYIALLEQRAKELEEQKIQALNLEKLRQDQNHLFAYLIAFQERWLRQQESNPKKFAEALRSIQQSALEDQERLLKQGISSGTDGSLES